jgi:hypothetical protein
MLNSSRARGEETKTKTITMRVEPSVKAASLVDLTPEIKDASPALATANRVGDRSSPAGTTSSMRCFSSASVLRTTKSTISVAS